MTAPAALLGLGSDPHVIITVTLNPSLDLTYTLCEVGRDIDVHRASRSTLEASGKGVNVSRILNMVAVPTVAVLPAGGLTGRLLLRLLDAEGVSHQSVPQTGETRVNTTALGPGGTMTKFNGPGARLEPAEQVALVERTKQALRGAHRKGGESLWVALCGSLPPGVEAPLIVDLVEVAHAHGAKCVIDASGEALSTALTAHPDLLAPNRRELSEVTGAVSCDGSVEQFADAARELARRTGAELLVSLDQDGALYTDGTRVMHGYGASLHPVNTAGAGDALLAGWLSAEKPPRSRLASAVGWGRSACLAPTTVDDTPGQRDESPVTVEDLT